MSDSFVFKKSLNLILQQPKNSSVKRRYTLKFKIVCKIDLKLISILMNKKNEIFLHIFLVHYILHQLKEEKHST